jgi:TPR repeat protein
MLGRPMRGLSIRVLTAAFLSLLIPVGPPSLAAPLVADAHGVPPRLGLVRVADDDAEDERDIIRLLPPGRGPSSDASSTPDLPVPPAGGGTVPGQGLRLSGQTIQVPITFRPWPGQPHLAYAGIRLDGVTDPALASALGLDTPTGVLVVDATPGAPAAEAGLRFGDVLTALDGAPILQTGDFIAAVKTRAPGSQGTLTVWRVGDDAIGYLQAVRDLAGRGSTPAMMFLARLYTNGTGVQQNAQEAVSWYRKAALAGSTNGMLLYGDALATGQGGVKDLAEAQRWIRRSAEAGNVAALFRLGRMYRDGEGMMRDPLEAINLFKKAAAANYTPAMVAVGLMFEGGGGLEADHLQAVQWYKQAADAGDAEGMAALGTMYSTGRGVERNPATAAAWYIEAAKRGQLLAIHNLAYHYDKGIGVARDPQLAADYIYQALERRYPFTYQQMLQNSRAWSREFRRALQQRLAAAGFYGGTVDGTFGRTTYDAINAMVQTQ